MRARSTWQSEKSETPRQAATSRKADIYTMNQEHPQPSPVDYESGSPDTWAETPVPADKMSVKDEYDGDHVKRNEIGLGEFRDDTWKHKDSDKWNGKGKYDNAKMAAERKAMAAERLARATLRTADESLVESAAIDLMALPDKSLVAMLKRLDAVSPDSLPEQSKFKRALACTKLAVRMLGDSATPETVERLASVVMTIDDPTLKTIVRTIASARTAQQQEQEEEQQGKTSQVQVQGQQQEEEEEEQQGKTSQQQEQQEEEEEQQTAQQQMMSQEQQEQEEEEEITSQEQQEAHGLSPEEMSMLDSMLKEEQAEHGCAPGAPAAPGMPAPAAPPGDDLAALFSGAPAPAAMPMTASDISFDEDDGEPAAPAPAAQVAGDLDHLFADDPEVQAQREIQAATLEARAREGGFAGRTASAKGAKKLGAVQKPAKVSADQALESIWDRP